MFSKMKSGLIKFLLLTICLFVCVSCRPTPPKVEWAKQTPIQEISHSLIANIAQKYYQYPNKKIVNVKIDRFVCNYDSEPLFQQYLYDEIYQKLKEATQLKIFDENSSDLDAKIEVDVIYEKPDTIKAIINVIDAKTLFKAYVEQKTYKLKDFDLAQFNNYKASHSDTGSYSGSGTNTGAGASAYTGSGRNFDKPSSGGTAFLNVQACYKGGLSYKEVDRYYLITRYNFFGNIVDRYITRYDTGNTSYFVSQMECQINGKDYSYDEDYSFFNGQVPPGRYDFKVSFEATKHDAYRGRDEVLEKVKRTFSINIEPNDNVQINVLSFFDGKTASLNADVYKLKQPYEDRQIPGAGVEWDLLNQEATSFYVKGQYDRAAEVAKRALQVAEQTVGPDHPNVATSRDNLARIYDAQGQYAQSEQLYNRSVAIDANAPAGSAGEGIDLQNLATLYTDNGQYAQAEPLYKRSLTILENTLGPEHRAVGGIMNNLALLYTHQGRYAEAELLYKRSLVISEKVLGPDHSDVATSLMNLGEVYRHTDQHAQAEPLLIRALTIKEKSLGPDHPDVADCLNTLAKLYIVQGQYVQAEPLLIRALAIKEKSFGPDHPDVASSLNNLSVLYSNQGQYAQAEPLQKRSLAIREKAVGPEHPEVGTSLSNLAIIYIYQGRYAEAEPLINRTLAIEEKTFGPEHPEVAQTLKLMAILYRKTGRESAAEKLEQRAAAILAIKR